MAYALNTGHALYANLIELIGVEGGALVSLKTARTFTKHAEASYGTGTYGEHFRAVAGNYTAKGASFTPAIPSDTVSNPNRSLFAVINAATASGGNGARPMLSGAGSNLPALGLTAANLVGAFSSGASTTATASGTTNLSSGSHSIGLSREDTTACSVHVDGVNEGTGGQLGNDQARDYDYIGGVTGAASVAADIVWIAVFDKTLSDAEHLSLHNSLGAGNVFGLVTSDTPATAIDLSGPASGLTSAASTNFTVTADENVSGDVTVTPASNLAGTFSPATPVILDGTDSITFTFTPTAPGSHSITLTNDGSLTNPSAHSYTVSDPDATAPNLSNAAVSAIAATTATLSVDTDEGNGTLYAIASTSATPPSVAHIQAGNDNSGSASAYAGNMSIGTTGTKQFSATGLSASTTYYPYYQHIDASSNDSTVLAGASFDTAAPNNPPTFPGPNIGNQSGQESVALGSVDVSGSFADVDAMTFTALGTWPAGVTVSGAGVISGVPSAEGSYTGLQVRATDTAAQTVDSDTFSFTISAPPPPGTITLLPCEMHNGTTLASTTLRAVHVYDVADNHLVTFHDVALNGSGTATLNDASIVTGGNYDVDIVRNDLTSSPGRRRYTAS